MIWDHVIRGGTIVTPQEVYEADIYIRDGKIAAISKRRLPGEASNVANLQKCLHILHVSTGEAVDLIRQAQEQGYPITAETCPHYLFLSNEDFAAVGPAMKVYPPVKYKKDQERLWKGIAEGVVSIVCSDHAPHTEQEKDGDLWSIPAGMCGVETLAPLMLNAVSQNRLSLSQVAAVSSENPAKQFGIFPQKGRTVMRDGQIVSGPIGRWIHPVRQEDAIGHAWCEQL